MSEQVEDRKQFSADQRKELADKGHALPDGSFPIVDCEDVSNAVALVGHATDPAKARAHIISRAHTLGCKLPDSWTEKRSRPETGQVEERALDGDGAASVTARRLHGVIPYGIESRDLGGWTEIIDRGAIGPHTDVSGLIATREHDRSHLLGRYPTTLTTEDRAHGFTWSVDLPSSPLGEDVRVSVERGDLRASSWRQVVAPGGERWVGNVRHVTRIAELRDVCVTAAPAYGDEARAEYRSLPSEPEVTPEPDEEAVVDEPEAVTPPAPPTGGLTPESRSQHDRVTRGLTDEFRSRGFPGEKATLSWDEYESRALVWSGTADVLAPDTRRVAAPLGADQRYAWPAFGRIGVGPEITSVPVLVQTARALAQVSDVIRDLAVTTPKAETGTTFDLQTVSLQQVAAIQSNVPNILLLQPSFNPAVETDLRLTVNDALDSLVLAEVAKVGHQAPGANLVDSIRAAIETLTAAGYSPDVLIVDPATATTLDTLKATATPTESWYVFNPGQAAPSVFGLNRRVATKAPAPVVLDSSAFGKLYASPVSLARFEENAGATNSATVRLELTAAFGTERPAAAVRIASS